MDKEFLADLGNNFSRLLQKFFQHFSLKLIYFPAIFLKYMYHFPAQKHRKDIKFQHTRASILLPIPRPNIYISAIPTIVDIGK